MLPTDSNARKDVAIHRGLLLYFPDALAAVSRVSKKGNDKHNPGQPMRWSREKSSDHTDCVGRHLIDAGPDWTGIDESDGELHVVHMAWRALAAAQIALERLTPRGPASVPAEDPNRKSTWRVPCGGTTWDITEPCTADGARSYRCPKCEEPVRLD